MTIFISVLVLGLIPSIWITRNYNSFISKRNRVDYAYGSIDVMLKKRHDLLPALVKVVQLHLQHENNLADKLMELGSQTDQEMGPVRQKIEFENQLSHQLNQWRAVARKYPAFRSTENFLQLQASLNEAEEQLSAARRAYNGTVFAYNTSIERFPANILAKALGHEPLAMFELADTARETNFVNV